ncbi:MAG: N-6 DNA methylase [Deltaproteobacteria bacterium]|nr:N-6 DNA methylase [Deltaproteobacteria bacterium]
MRGVHYTPAPVARFMVEASLGRWLRRGTAWRNPAEVDAVRILDPACGDGAFLLAAFDCLLDWHLARARAVGLRVAPGLGRRLAAGLHGVDLDAGALERAAAALAGRVGAADGERGAAAAATLCHGDALLEPAVAGDFDFVLGNPPYVFGELLGAHEKRAYQRFDLGRGGQPDLFKLFFERSFRDFLRPGGTHAFLVPDALLARDEHADLRAWIARQGTVVRLCHVGRVFPRAGVSSVVVVTEKVPGGDRRCAVDRWDGDHATPVHEVAAASLTGAGGEPWAIWAPPAWHGRDGLRARLEAAGTLGRLLEPGPPGLTRGEEVGKSALRDCPRPGQAARGHVAIYAGADVQRHRLAPPRKQAARRAVVKDAAFYRGPKILVVKTGAGPVAAVAADDLPALQSVYLLHLLPGTDPDGVVAIVCSALVTVYAWYAWTSGKRLQPQLTLGNVRALPFPVRRATPALLVALGDRVRALRRDLGRLARAASGAGSTLAATVRAQERTIDEEVARWFGLSLDEWLPELRPALDALPASQRPRWWPPRP